jgi:glycosyltransferase involved in cell wall biosynthesis
MLKKWGRWFLDFFWIPLKINKFKPDIVLTLCNLPAITSFKQCFVHDNPYLTASNISDLPLLTWEKIIHKFRNRMTLHRMRFVDLVLVQTKYQQEFLKSKVEDGIQIKLLAPAVPLFEVENKKETLNHNYSKENIKLLCLSRYYPHKNIEFLLDLGQLIISKNASLSIYLTINPNQDRRIRKLLSTISKKKLDDTIINLGQIKHKNIPFTILNTDAILIPTLLESFSLSFIEAWYYKKPLFTSNLESIRSSCCDAAFYFNPYSPVSALNCIVSAFNNQTIIQSKVDLGIVRINQLPKWEDYVTVVNEL